MRLRTSIVLLNTRPAPIRGYQALSYGLTLYTAPLAG